MVGLGRKIVEYGGDGALRKGLFQVREGALGAGGGGKEVERFQPLGGSAEEAGGGRHWGGGGRFSWKW